jgi:hypothetical protein
VKIAEGIIDFIFHLLKRAILVFVIGFVMIFALVLFTIFMPDEVVNALNIIGGFLS